MKSKQVGKGVPEVYEPFKCIFSIYFVVRDLQIGFCKWCCQGVGLKMDDNFAKARKIIFIYL